MLATINIGDYHQIQMYSYIYFGQVFTWQFSVDPISVRASDWSEDIYVLSICTKSIETNRESGVLLEQYTRVI